MSDNNWPEYLRQITDDAPGSAISRATGIPESTVSRWLSGSNRPKPRQVVAVAHAFKVNPISALIASDYLGEGDIELTEAPRRLQIADFTDIELSQEMVRRVIAGKSSVLEDPLDENHPAMQDLDLEHDGNVSRMSHYRAEDEAKELGAVAKPGDGVIEIEEFD